MADVTLQIDARSITVPAGTTILTAARALGIHIPTFCFHEGLSIAANCRMCLVESDRSRNLVPACHAQVVEGMQVLTDSERVREAQRAVLEFILVNHPVDCPICDQAGECDLQDNYREHDLQASRLTTPKVRKPKVKRLGPYVVYDGERCILCTRCVRFVDEVSRSNDLTVVNRGDHSEITTFPGRELDNPYSMCTADLCPVGALTTIPFRFRARVWWLESTPSVCDRCARGCAIRIDTRRNEIQRYLPRENPSVNQWWMCDAGRISFQEDVSGRLATARLVDGAVARETSTREAAASAIERLVAARAAGARLAVLLSPNLSNESLLNAVRLAGEGLGLSQVYLGGRPDGEDQDHLLIRDDKNANRFGAERIAAAAGLALRPHAELERELQTGGLDALLAFGDEHPLSAGARESLGRLQTLIVVSPRQGVLAEAAHVAIPSCAFFEQEGSFTNFQGHVQRFQAAVQSSASVHPEWKIAARLAGGLGVQLPSEGAAAVYAELAARVSHFAGTSLEGLGETGSRPAAAQGEGE